MFGILRVTGGVDQGRMFTLVEGETLVIGRGSGRVGKERLHLCGEARRRLPALGRVHDRGVTVARQRRQIAPPFQRARELEILRLLIDGNTNKEIARSSSLQEITVKVHLRNAYRKMGATNRADAVRIAFQHGWE